MSKFAPHRRGTSSQNFIPKINDPEIDTGLNNPPATSSTVCQKCLGKGHYIYECKSSRPYVSRPSRTEQLEKPGILAKLKKDGKPSLDLPEEFKTKTGTANKILEDKERQRAKEGGSADNGRPKKKARRSTHSSDSDSSGSDSLSESSSSSGSDSSASDSDSSDSQSMSSRSRSRDRKRRRPRQHSRSSSRNDKG